jgi:isoleucyl-tRNA synthetase
LKEFKGKDLLNVEYRCPVIKTNHSFVVEGHHVNSEAGSGLVHIAPLFGEDDFIIGKKNNLNEIMHINDDGTLNNTVKEYEGLFYQDVNKSIGMKLDENNQLLSLKFLKHSYPHD